MWQAPFFCLYYDLGFLWLALVAMPFPLPVVKLVPSRLVNLDFDLTAEPCAILDQLLRASLLASHRG